MTRTERFTEVRVQFRVVSLIREENANAWASGKGTLSNRVYEGLLGVVLRSFHFSILRQVLLETRSLIHRISWSRCRRTALDFAEVRQSLPQVSCSRSRNETQYCTASIEKLSEERPYLTLSDYRLLVEGFFLAEKWFLHTGMEHRKTQYAPANPDGGNSMPPSGVPQPSRRNPSNPLPWPE
jgi:hypothetical protein